MRVALLNWYANRAGGADVYTEALAVGLTARGRQVTVICHEASAEVEQACEVVRFPRSDFTRWPVAWRIGPWLQWADCQRRLARLPLRPPDVVIASPVFCLHALARRFPNVPRVYLPHARIAPLEVAENLAGSHSRLLRWTAYRLYHRLERWALMHSDTTVRFTQGNVDLLRTFYRLPARVRFEVIPPAVSFPAWPNRPNGRPPIPLLTVGRLVESKNVGFLLRSLSGMRDLSWRLDVVGDGPLRAQLEATAREAGLADRVAFHGHSDDVSRHYREADLFVFPSRLESFGLVILEAMAHGVPTLAIKSDGKRYLNSHHEVLTDGTDGLLAADEARFAEMLRAAIASPARLHELGLRARQTVFDRHRWDVVLDRWELLLEEMVCRRSRHARLYGSEATASYVESWET